MILFWQIDRDGFFVSVCFTIFVPFPFLSFFTLIWLLHFNYGSRACSFDNTIMLNCLVREMKMSTGENLQAGLLSRTPPFGLRLWVVLGISIWAAILFVLGCICFFLIYWRKRGNRFGDTAEPEIPDITKEIAVDEARNGVAAENVQRQESYTLSLKERQTNKGSRKMLAHFLSCKSSGSHNLIGCSSMYQNDKAQCSYSSDEGTSGHNEREYSQYATMSTSPQIGLPEFSHLGWGYWFTLRDLEDATNGFSDDNIIGEGGYGVVYHGRLINGTDVAIKRLFNNM